MKGFKLFINESEEQEKNIKATLERLPKSHGKLVKGYKFIWQGDNVLKGDDKHIGIINPKNKTVTVAAPWRYSRQYTFLHELAHMVWAAFITKELKSEWSKIVKKTKANMPKKHNSSSMDQNDEELFCMAYASRYADHAPEIFYHDDWLKFINKIPS